MKNLFISKTGQLSFFLLTLCLVLFTVSCNDDNDEILPSTNTEVSLASVADALGGADYLESINTISYRAEGNSFEYEQDIPDMPSPLTSNHYAYNFQCFLNNRKLRMDHEFINFYHPTFYETRGPLTIINDNVGTVSKDFIWKSYYLGVDDAHAMFATEIEANLKNQLMANPLELLKDILNNYPSTTPIAGNKLLVKTRVEGSEIELVIDEATNLPIKASTMEADFLKGDVSFEVTYEDWVKVGDTQFPSKVEYVLDGDVFKSEEITNININPAIEDSMFEPESVEHPIAYDEAQADFGIVHSQFYHRWNAWNIGWPEPVNNGALDLSNFDLAPFGIGSQYIGPDVKVIGRPDNRLWNVAIKTDNGVVIIDSPLNQKWTRSLLNATKVAFPDEEIVATISTHAHHDHFAGIREAAYETGKIYIGEESVEELNQVLEGKHTIMPDNLAKNPRNVEIEAVKDITYLDNGNIEIHRLKPSNTTAHAHSDDMLIVYLPKYELVIQADQLWNGTFTFIYRGMGYNGFTPEAKAEISNNAKYLRDYIIEKDLKVSKIVAMHGGLGPVEDLDLMIQD